MLSESERILIGVYEKSINTSVCRALAVDLSLTRLFQLRTFADHVRRSVHGAKMNSCQVFTENPQCKELHTGKNGNDRCEKWKPRHTGALDKISTNNPYQDTQSKNREYEPNHTRQLKRKRTKTGDQVEIITSNKQKPKNEWNNFENPPYLA